jgi:hypothetical protein
MTKDQDKGSFSTVKWRRLAVGLSTAAVLTVGCLALALTTGCADRSSPAAMTASLPQSMATAVPSNQADQNNTASAQTSTAAADAPTTSANSAAPSANQPAREISFDNVKFNMQKDEPFQRTMITPAIEKLANTKIRIRGYILPSFQQTGLSQFVLVRDNMQCCFGPGAALYDCIVVQMTEGHTADFTNRPIAVQGVFSIQEIASPEGKCLAIYHLQADKVE